MKLHAIGAILTLSLAGHAAAQECDPVTILRQDTSSTTLKGETALIYAKQTTESTARSQASGGSIGFAVYGVPVNVGYQTANALASYVENRLGINYSNKEYAQYLRSSFSDNALAAYEACLDRQTISLSTPAESYKEEEFFVNVRWKGGPFPPAGATLTLRATNGKLGDGANPTNVLTVPVESESVIPVRVSARDVSKLTMISAQVSAAGGSDASPAVVPPYKPFELTTNVAKSPVLKRKGPRYTPRESSVCVEATKGVLIPETAAWLILGKTAGTSERINPGATTKQACGTLRARGSDFGEASITGQLTVHEIVATPINPTAAEIMLAPN